MNDKEYDGLGKPFVPNKGVERGDWVKAKVPDPSHELHDKLGRVREIMSPPVYGAPKKAKVDFYVDENSEPKRVETDLGNLRAVPAP